MAEPTSRIERAAALRARAALLEQADRKAARDADTKRKIVVGGTVLAMMKDDPDLHGRVVHKLREMTEGRPADQRAVADLIFSANGAE